MKEFKKGGWHTTPSIFMEHVSIAVNFGSAKLTSHDIGEGSAVRPICAF
jgi:hypothetical protein